MDWRIVCGGAAVCCLIACGGGGSNSSAGTAPPIVPPSTPKNPVLAYGSNTKQFGVLHLPPGTGPFPLLVLLHGGCWRSSVASYGHVEPLADALAAKGWAVWNVEYRTVDEPDGGWPSTFTDVAAAVDYVRTLRTMYPLDASRTVFAGHSAGGHLALWAASRDRVPPGSRLASGNPLLPQRVITLAAITDLQSYANGNSCGASIPALIGNADLNEVSPLQMLPTGMPLSLITAASDTIVPLDQEQRYEDAAKALGVSVRHTEVTGDHLSLVRPEGGGAQAMLTELAAE